MLMYITILTCPCIDIQLPCSFPGISVNNISGAYNNSARCKFVVSGISYIIQTMYITVKDSANDMCTLFTPSKHDQNWCYRWIDAGSE